MPELDVDSLAAAMLGGAQTAEQPQTQQTEQVSAQIEQSQPAQQEQQIQPVAEQQIVDKNPQNETVIKTIEAPPPTLWEQLKSETGIDIDKEKFLDIVEQTKRNPYAHDAVKAFNEHVANGGNPETWIKANATKYEEFSPEQRIKAHLSEQYPELNSDEVGALFKHQYGEYDADDFSTEAMAARARLKVDDAKALAYLNQRKVKDLAPVQKEDTGMQEIQRKHFEAVERFAPSLEKIDFKFQTNDVSDPQKVNTQQFEWKIDKDERDKLINYAKTPAKILELCATEDGQALDPNKLITLAFFAKNQQRFLSSFANTILSSERERFIQEDLKNTNRQSNPVHRAPEKSIQQALAEKMLGI